MNETKKLIQFTGIARDTIVRLFCLEMFNCCRRGEKIAQQSVANRYNGLTTGYSECCYTPAPIVGALSDDGRLTSVCRVHRA